MKLDSSVVSSEQNIYIAKNKENLNVLLKSLGMSMNDITNAGRTW